MGLSISQTLIHSHSGELTLKTIPQVVHASVSNWQLFMTIPPVMSPTVFVVDDDEDLRDSVVTLLPRFGVCSA